MVNRAISVLLVDDSPIAIAILKRILASVSDIKVIGVAQNGKEAMRLIPQLNPDVVCTDFLMPVMDGLMLISWIMANTPRPIIVLSAYVGKGSDNIFRLLEAGALDIVSKPNMEDEKQYAAISSDIINKIRIVSGVHMFRRPEKKNQKVLTGNELISARKEAAPVKIIVIGASTGGPQALGTIFSALPADFPVPIICIQHISEGFLVGLVSWLSSNCAMKIEFAQDQGVPDAGVIYFQPEERQLTFTNGRFDISRHKIVKEYQPSINPTMKSVANCYGSGTMGVLLTGMGNDGAEGLLEIASVGGITIVQDEKSSVIFGMPKQAIKLGAARYILPLDDISTTLRRLSKK